jgi:hypothetical protein
MLKLVSQIICYTSSHSHSILQLYPLLSRFSNTHTTFQTSISIPKTPLFHQPTHHALPLNHLKRAAPSTHFLGKQNRSNSTSSPLTLLTFPITTHLTPTIPLGKPTTTLLTPSLEI